MNSQRPPAPVIEVAVLETPGAVRGSETNELVVLRQQWAKASVQKFDNDADLEAWRINTRQSRSPVAKVIYDRAAGEVRVWLVGARKSISKTIPVERDLATALREAEQFIKDPGP